MRYWREFTICGDAGRGRPMVRPTTHSGLPILGFILIGLILLVVATNVMAQGSCQGACGGQSADGCWCDEECVDSGDCCADREQVCAAAGCQGSCGFQSPAGCWCDEGCVANGDCCADKEQVCTMSDMPDVPNIVYCVDVAMWPLEQKILEEEVLPLVNQHRAQGADCRTAGIFAPALPLTMNPNLRCAARKHSKDMVERIFFDHINPDGAGVGERFLSAEYIYRIFGENIAVGNATAAATVDQWMSSDRHCANMMNPDFTDIGVGYFPGGAFSYYWTQVFGTPLAPTP
jgi:uncharacterized protein YkwD